MKRIYFIISLLLFTILAVGQTTYPSLIYSDNPRMLNIDGKGGQFTYRYRVYMANPDNIQSELEAYLQSKNFDWLTIVGIEPDNEEALTGNIRFEATENYTGKTRLCQMMSAIPRLIYLISQPSSIDPPKYFSISGPQSIVLGHKEELTLNGSEEGVIYHLYHDGILQENKQGTGSPLKFQITAPGIYLIEGVCQGITTRMGEVLVHVQKTDLYNNDHNYVLEKVYTSSTSISDSTLCIRNITYTDGLGRRLQETQIGASPSGMDDLISLYEYGVLGRTEKEYLGYAKTKNWGAYVPNAYETEHWNIYGNADAAYAFTKTEYDNSPLDRVTKQTGAGAAWHTTGKGVTSAYALNMENEVRLYNVDLFTGTLSLDGSYNAGSLQKVTATDEDGHSVETFTDNTDKTVLTVTVDGEKRLETYYVYDDREQLRWVLSPEASYQLGTTVDATLLNRLAYYYGYDRLGRMTVKRLPGCEPIYMVYDKRDRMVLSQDGNQRTADSKKWSYSVYDNNNRIVESGEMILSTANTHKQLQDAAWNSESYLPAGTKTPLQYTVYDSYEATTNVTAHPFVAVTGYASDYHKAVTGLVTSTKTRILETETWLTATTYYDEKCRPPPDSKR